MKYYQEHMSSPLSEEELKGLSEFAEYFVHTVDDVDLIITGNWQKSMATHSSSETNSLVADAGGIALYNKKTARHIILILYVEDSMYPLEEVPRTIAHEAFHVANRQRGEDIIKPTGDFSPLYKKFFNIAANAIEEYRVELAIHRGFDTSQVESKIINLEYYNSLIKDCRDKVDNQKDIVIISRHLASTDISDEDVINATGIFNNLHWAAYFFAHALGAAKGTNDNISAERIILNEDIKVERETMAALLLQLPDASEEASIQLLQETLTALGNLIMDWAKNYDIIYDETQKTLFLKKACA